MESFKQMNFWGSRNKGNGFLKMIIRKAYLKIVLIFQGLGGSYNCNKLFFLPRFNNNWKG